MAGDTGLPRSWWYLAPHAAIDPLAGTVVLSPRRPKVAIVGHASPTNGLAPYGDPAWEIWSANAPTSALMVPEMREVHRWFQLHPLAVLEGREKDWVPRCPVPLYTIDHEPSVPMSVRYPIERVLAMPGALDFFACTMAYEVALAVLDGFEAIGLYGIELPRGTARERSVEWASVAWWCGYASGRGITVTAPGSALLDYPWRYGADYWEEVDYVNALLKGVEPDEKLPPRDEAQERQTWQRLRRRIFGR